LGFGIPYLSRRERKKERKGRKWGAREEKLKRKGRAELLKREGRSEYGNEKE
jgi:hypothetical protein